MDVMAAGYNLGEIARRMAQDRGRLNYGKESCIEKTGHLVGLFLVLFFFDRVVVIIVIEAVPDPSFFFLFCVWRLYAA